MVNKNDWQGANAAGSIKRDYQDGGPIMKKLGMLGIIGGAAILTAVPLSLQWSQKNGCYRLPARSPRTAANCDERCRCQPKGISPRIPQRGLRKGCWLRLWIVLRLWMSGVFQLLGTLRNKLLCTLWHLRQQLCPSLRASEIRLRRTVRTDFLLRVPAASPRARPGVHLEHLREIRADQIAALHHTVCIALWAAAQSIG